MGTLDHTSSVEINAFIQWAARATLAELRGVDGPAVYILRANGVPIKVGKSACALRRIRHHFSHFQRLHGDADGWDTPWGVFEAEITVEVVTGPVSDAELLAVEKLVCSLLEVPLVLNRDVLHVPACRRRFDGISMHPHTGIRAQVGESAGLPRWVHPVTATAEELRRWQRMAHLYGHRAELEAERGS